MQQNWYVFPKELSPWRDANQRSSVPEADATKAFKLFSRVDLT
jgi:hypothetical protein